MAANDILCKIKNELFSQCAKEMWHNNLRWNYNETLRNKKSYIYIEKLKSFEKPGSRNKKNKQFNGHGSCERTGKWLCLPLQKHLRTEKVHQGYNLSEKYFSNIKFSDFWNYVRSFSATEDNKREWAIHYAYKTLEWALDKGLEKTFLEERWIFDIWKT